MQSRRPEIVDFVSNFQMCHEKFEPVSLTVFFNIYAWNGYAQFLTQTF